MESGGVVACVVVFFFLILLCVGGNGYVNYRTYKQQRSYRQQQSELVPWLSDINSNTKLTYEAIAGGGGMPSLCNCIGSKL